MPRTRTSWPAGVSGNPRGRPRGAWGWRKRVYERVVADVEASGQLSPESAETLIERALSGDLYSVRRLLDQMDERG